MQKRNQNISVVTSLKDIASSCIITQIISSLFYLFCSVIFPESNVLAVTSGIIAIAIALTPIFYAVTRRKFEVLFSCISAFNLAPIWFLYLEGIIPGYDAYEYIRPVTRMEAFFWIAIFQICGNLFYIIFWKIGNRVSLQKFDFLRFVNFKPQSYVKFTLLSFIVPLLAFYYFYGSAEILWTAITGGRSGGGATGGLLMQDAIGNSSSFMLPLNWIWQLTPLFGTIAFISSKQKSSLSGILSLILGIVVIFAFFLSGSRGTMIFVAAPVLFFLFYYNWDKGFKFWLPAAALFLLIIGIMELQVRFRGNLLDVLSNPEQAAIDNGYESATTFNPAESHRDNNMYLFCLMVKGYPSKYDFEGLTDFFAVIVNPIPRAIWPSKPLLKGAQGLSNQYSFVLDGPLLMGTTSLSYSVVGEAYLAGGFWGIAIYAFFYALFFLFFDGVLHYSTKDRPISIGILGIGVFLSFWGYRAFFALVSFLYPILLLIIVLQFVKKKKRNENNIYSS